ncbi:DNA-binding protein (plasmid) [Brevibacillus fluminis]|uniref:DNA-binding protein n=1 Tax=Brevibacillus fluminis TaxID=511487 RepID=UPI003F89E016
MARPGVGREEILAAAEAIFAEGKEPTQVLVRERLGGGSFTTISAALKDWRAERKAPAAPIRETAPEALTELVDRVSGEIWALAQQIANERLKTEREAMEAVRQQMEQQQQEAAAFADRLVEEVEQQRNKIEELQTSLLGEQGQKNLLSDLLQQVRMDEAVATARNDELQRSLEVAHRDINRFTTQIDELTESNRVQLMSIVELQTLNQSLRDQLDEAKRVSAAAAQDHERFRVDAYRQRDQANEELSIAQIEQARLSGQVEILRDRVVQLQEENKQLADKLAKPAARKRQQDKSGQSEQV